MKNNQHLFVSGICALALQIISFKYISVFGLGDAISVAISLTVFVAMSGLGAVLGGRMKPDSAPSLEMAMGAYACLLFGPVVVFGLDTIGLTWTSSYSGMIVSVVAILSPIAVLSGALITAYEDGDRVGDKSDFVAIYSAFHVGGAVSLIAIELYGLPVIGWPLLGVGFGIVSIVMGLEAWSRKLPGHAQSEPFDLSKAKAVKLFVVSVITGIAGVAIYKSFNYLVGPNIRNYSVVTASIMLGLGVSGVWAMKRSIDFDRMIAYSGYGVFWLMAVPVLISMSGLTALMPVWIAYATVILVVAIPGYALMGLSIPVARQSGFSGAQVLLIVSLGNAVGYWVYVGIGSLNIDLLVLVIAAVALGTLGKSSFKAKYVLMNCFLALVMTGLDSFSLHQTLLKNQMIENEKRYDPSSGDVFDVEFIESWNTWAWPVDHIRVTATTPEGAEFDLYEQLIIDGFRSLTMNPPYSRVVASESIAALLPSLFVGQRDKALVLGAGTGTSAGAVSKFFGSTDLVDLNADTPDMMEHFGFLNVLEEHPVSWHQKDAMSFVRNSESDKYNYVFSTVTGAGYPYSAALYTREFFQEVDRALKDEGVFAFWLDGRLNSEGTSKVMKALSSVFKYQKVKTVRANDDRIWEAMPYIVIMGSQSPFDNPGRDNPILIEILQLDAIVFETDNGLVDPDWVLGPRNTTICLDPEAKPASMAQLSFAYDYKIELSILMDADKEVEDLNTWCQGKTKYKGGN